MVRPLLCITSNPSQLPPNNYCFSADISVDISTGPKDWPNSHWSFHLSQTISHCPCHIDDPIWKLLLPLHHHPSSRSSITLQSADRNKNQVTSQTIIKLTKNSDKLRVQNSNQKPRELKPAGINDIQWETILRLSWLTIFDYMDQRFSNLENSTDECSVDCVLLRKRILIGSWRRKLWWEIGHIILIRIVVNWRKSQKSHGKFSVVSAVAQTQPSSPPPNTHKTSSMMWQGGVMWTMCRPNDVKPTWRRTSVRWMTAQSVTDIKAFKQNIPTIKEFWWMPKLTSDTCGSIRVGVRGRKVRKW